jgi:hypothetical protein
MFWLGQGLQGSVPFALVAFLSVFLHSRIWIYEAWDLELALRSLGLSALLLLAWAFRLRAQVGLFEEAVRSASEAMDVVGVLPGSEFETSSGRAVAAGFLGLGLGVLLLPACFLPGVLVLCVTIILPPVLLVEGRDLPSALRRCLRLSLPTLGRGLGTLLFFGVLHLLLWLTTMLACSGGIELISALFGVDVGRAHAVLTPSNSSFFFGCGILAWLLLEPLWLLQRSLMYLDVVLGASGADLRASWAAIKADSAGRPSGDRGLRRPVLILLLFAGLGFAGSPGEAAAEDSGSAHEFPDPIEVYAASLEALAIEVDQALSSSDPSDGRDLGNFVDQLKDRGQWVFLLPEGGELQLDLRPALGPDVLGRDDAENRETLRAFESRLRAAAAAALRGARPALPTTASAAQDPRSLLAEELQRGGYSLVTRTREERVAGPSVLERLFEWLEEWFEGYEPEPEPQWEGPTLQLPMSWVFGIGLTLFALFALIFGWFARRRQVGEAGTFPDPGLGGSGSPLPDARSRSVTAWRSLAEASAAAGQFRDAIRSLFLAVLAQLEERREIEYRPSASNGEHLHSFSGSQLRRDCFVLAVISFEIAWFSGQGAGGVDWQQMRQRCDPLLGLADNIEGATDV